MFTDEKYDFGYQSEEKEARGLGYYEQKPYNPEIKIICKVGELILRTVATSINTKFEIVDDGMVLNRYPNLKTAEMFFIDFAGITKAKYNKIKLA